MMVELALESGCMTGHVKRALARARLGDYSGTLFLDTVPGHYSAIIWTREALVSAVTRIDEG